MPIPINPAATQPWTQRSAWCERPVIARLMMIGHPGCSQADRRGSHVASEYHGNTSFLGKCVYGYVYCAKEWREGNVLFMVRDFFFLFCVPLQTPQHQFQKNLHCLGDFKPLMAVSSVWSGQLLHLLHTELSSTHHVWRKVKGHAALWLVGVAVCPRVGGAKVCQCLFQAKKRAAFLHHSTSSGAKDHVFQVPLA